MDIKIEDLKNNRNDFYSIVLKTTCNLIPGVGSVIGEIIGNLIPNQRMDRIAKFLNELFDRISHLEMEILEKLKSDEEFIDLLEESFIHASRAKSEERRKYLISIIINGINDENITFEESKYLLKLLAEINDVEIIWLKRYSIIGLKEIKEFETKHENILIKIRVPVGGDELLANKSAFQNNYLLHLERLGLIVAKIKSDNLIGRKNTPLVDSKGQLIIYSYNITTLGMLLIRQIEE